MQKKQDKVWNKNNEKKKEKPREKREKKKREKLVSKSGVKLRLCAYEIDQHSPRSITTDLQVDEMSQCEPGEG